MPNCRLGACQYEQQGFQSCYTHPDSGNCVLASEQNVSRQTWWCPVCQKELRALATVEAVFCEGTHSATEMELKTIRDPQDRGQ